MMESLVLYNGDEVIFSSDKSGLRPLLECIQKGKKGDRLFDKVIGLAAARLIAHSGIACVVSTPIISKPAVDYLKKKG